MARPTAAPAGVAGLAQTLTAYALLQLNRLGSHDRRYLVLNAAGSALILVSLLDDVNLPSFVTQAAWLVFTAVGSVRSRGGRDRPATGTDSPSGPTAHG